MKTNEQIYIYSEPSSIGYSTATSLAYCLLFGCVGVCSWLIIMFSERAADNAELLVSPISHFIKKWKRGCWKALGVGRVILGPGV